MNWSKNVVWTVDVMVSQPGSRTLAVRRYDVLAPSEELALDKGARLFRHFEPCNAELSVELVVVIEDRRAA